MKQHKSTLCYAALAKKKNIEQRVDEHPPDMWLRFNELSTAIFHLKKRGMELTLAKRRTERKNKTKICFDVSKYRGKFHLA